MPDPSEIERLIVKLATQINEIGDDKRKKEIVATIREIKQQVELQFPRLPPWWPPTDWFPWFRP